MPARPLTPPLPHNNIHVNTKRHQHQFYNKKLGRVSRYFIFLSFVFISFVSLSTRFDKVESLGAWKLISTQLLWHISIYKYIIKKQLLASSALVFRITCAVPKAVSYRPTLDITYNTRTSNYNHLIKCHWCIFTKHCWSHHYNNSLQDNSTDKWRACKIRKNMDISASFFLTWKYIFSFRKWMEVIS